MQLAICCNFNGYAYASLLFTVVMLADFIRINFFDLIIVLVMCLMKSKFLYNGWNFNFLGAGKNDN